MAYQWTREQKAALDKQFKKDIGNVHMQHTVSLWERKIVLRRSVVGYVAEFAPDYVVHIRIPQNRKQPWVAKKSFALEPIATAKTLRQCVAASLAHYHDMILGRLA